MATKSIIRMKNPKMLFKTLIAVVLLTLTWAISASSNFIIDGEFEIQPYELPNGQGYRHTSAIINEARRELILFGGIGNGPPRPPTPINEYVNTLDLTKPSSQQDWQERNRDDVIPAPWFTSTRGLIELNNNFYLACDDSDHNAVYTFNPNTYEFQFLSESPLEPQFNAGDCCAVGITIPNSRNHIQNKEERIYMLAGRNDFQNPVSDVRYYSITFREWGRAENLNIGRSHLGCASVERKGEPLIYAIGGGNSPEGKALRSIEIYNVIKDKWTLYDDYLPEDGGRTRLGVQNIDNKYLLLIGGDSTCAGGGSVNNCAPDQPMMNLDIIDIKRNNRFISDEYLIPQLQFGRATPATSLRKRKGNNQQDKYVLYVIGGRTRGEEGLDVLATTEVLSFDRIKVRNIDE